jgi:hypothetical protein
MGPLSVFHVHPIFGVRKFDGYDLRAWKLFGGFLVCDHESSIRSHRLFPVTFFFDLSRRPVLRLKEQSFKAEGRKFESCRSLYRLSSKLNSGTVAETVAGALIAVRERWSLDRTTQAVQAPTLELLRCCACAHMRVACLGSKLRNLSELPPRPRENGGKRAIRIAAIRFHFDKQN